VDCDYLRRLSPEERAWMHRFLAEYYDADNKLLRPQQHYAKCPACRAGGDCGRRPPPFALHDSDELRRECYRLQKSAYEDVYSRGRVMLWEDYGSVSPDGPTGTLGKNRKRAMQARVEGGDYVDVEYSPPPAALVPPTRRRK